MEFKRKSSRSLPRKQCQIGNLDFVRLYLAFPSKQRVGSSNLSGRAILFNELESPPITCSLWMLLTVGELHLALLLASESDRVRVTVRKVNAQRELSTECLDDALECADVHVGLAFNPG